MTARGSAGRLDGGGDGGVGFRGRLAQASISVLTAGVMSTGSRGGFRDGGGLVVAGVAAAAGGEVGTGAVADGVGTGVAPGGLAAAGAPVSTAMRVADRVAASCKVSGNRDRQ
jgi:hypothetical protein